MPKPERKITKERREFLDWLTDVDVTSRHPLFGNLSPDEHNFIAELLKVGYYDMNERARLRSIIQNIDKDINKHWSRYKRQLAKSNGRVDGLPAYIDTNTGQTKTLDVFGNYN